MYGSRRQARGQATPVDLPMPMPEPVKTEPDQRPAQRLRWIDSLAVLPPLLDSSHTGLVPSLGNRPHALRSPSEPMRVIPDPPGPWREPLASRPAQGFRWNSTPPHAMDFRHENCPPTPNDKDQRPGPPSAPVARPRSTRRAGSAAARGWRGDLPRRTGERLGSCSGRPQVTR